MKLLALYLSQIFEIFSGTKTKIAAVVGTPVGVVLYVIEKYIFDDLEFLGFLTVLIVLDTITGVVKHWRAKTISSDGWGRIIIKLFVYMVFLITIHNLTHFTVEGQSTVVFQWLNEVGYCIIMSREAISIFENIGTISPNIIPKWLLKRLKQFDETGSFNEK